MFVHALALALTTHMLTPLQTKLDAICNRFHGRIGYELKVLPTGEEIGYHQDDRFPTASTIKTGVMVAVLQQIDEGKLKFTDQHALPSPDNREASMWSFFLKEDVKPDVDGWVNLMITVSDNTATICLRDWLGTLDINSRLEKLGLKDTKILGNATSLAELHSVYGMGMTTPREMNKLFELINEGKAASPAACDKMIRILSHNYWDDGIPSTVPPNIKVANKPGAVTKSKSEAAIVYCGKPYILTVYTADQQDQRWEADNEGNLVIRKIAAEVWKYLNPKQPYQLPEGYRAKFDPTGGGV
jgi:beta-lactamase class A